MKSKHILSLTIIVASAVCLFREAFLSPAFLPGIDALGYIAGVANLSRHFRMLYLWGHGSFGAPYEFTFRLPLALLNVLINDAALTMKLFSLGCFLLAGFSMYFLVYRLTGSRMASTSSAILFTVNQFFIAKWVNGLYHHGFAYALLPLLFLSLDSALRNGKFRQIVAFSMIYSSLFFTRFDPIFLFTGFLFLYTLFTVVSPQRGKRDENRKAVFKNAAKTWVSIVILVILFSALLLAPIFVSSSEYLSAFVPEEAVTALDFRRSLFCFSAEMNYLIWTTNFSWTSHPFLSFPVYMFLMSLPAILGFGALLFRRDKWAIFLVSSALLSVFLAKGWNPPFGEVYKWLFNNFPFIDAIHFPNRWLAITCFCYACLDGMTINAIISKLRNVDVALPSVGRKLTRLLRSMAIPFVLLFVVSSVIPVSGILVEGIQPWLPTQDLLDAYTWVADKSGDYRIATVPYDQARMLAFWEPADKRWRLHDLGYQSRIWHDKAIVGARIDPQPALGFMRYTDSLVFENRTSSLMEILGAFNVRYLISQSYYPVDRPGPSPDFQHRFFSGQNGLEPVYSSGDTTIYENTFWNARLYAVDRYIVVVGGREALWFLVDEAGLDLCNTGVFFAHQVLRARGRAGLMELLNGAEGLVFVNTGSIDLAMLLLEDAIRIQPAKYGYHSVVTSKNWIPSSQLSDEGMPVLYDSSLTTSGNNSVSIPFKVDSNETYDIWVRLLYGPDRGNLTVAMDGVYMYTLTPTGFNYYLKWTNMGSINLSSGEHTLTLENTITLSGRSNTIDDIVLVKPSTMKSVTTQVSELTEDSIARGSSIIGPARTTVVTLTDPSVVVDSGQQSFWSVTNPEYVRLNPFQEEQPDKASNGSLKLEIHRSNRRNYAVLEHQFDTVQDWRGARYLVFWFKGQGTGTDFSLDVYFNDMSSYATYAIRDVSSSWRPVVISLTKPTHVGGTVDWGQVKHISLSNGDKFVTGTFYIGRLARAQDVEIDINFGLSAMKIVTLDSIDEKLVKYYLVEEEQHEVCNYYFGVDDVGVSRVLSYRQVNPTFYEVEVNASKPFYLMFSESYHPMWRAFVDGVGFESTPAYSFINSFPINRTGHLKITLEFTGQRYAAVGALISTASIAITLIIVFFRRKKIIVVLHKRKNKLSSRLNVGKSE